MKWEAIKKLMRNSYFKAGSIITLLAGLATVYEVLHPSGPEHNPAFLGRWESNYQHPVPGGTVAFNGITEYFRNGRYNVNGTLKFSGGAAEKPFSAVVLSKGSGTWTADNQFLTFTLTGLRTEPTSFKSGELEMPIALLEKLSGFSLPDMNKQYVPGSSDEYKIISQERKRIVLEGKDPFGDSFTVVYQPQ
jgi:hypothetical protein